MKLDFGEQEVLDRSRQLEYNRSLVNILKGLYDGWDEYWGYEGLLPSLRKFLSKGWEYKELGDLLGEVEMTLQGLPEEDRTKEIEEDHRA